MNEKVRIYAAPTWPHCKIAKEFFSQKDVAYTYYDVSADKDALAEMKKVSGGSLSVQVITIGDTVIIGFNADRLSKELDLHS